MGRERMRTLTVDGQEARRIAGSRYTTSDAMPLPVTGDCDGACKCQKCAARRASDHPTHGLTVGELDAKVRNSLLLADPRTLTDSELKTVAFSFSRGSSLSDFESAKIIGAHNELNRRFYAKERG